MQLKHLKVDKFKSQSFHSNLRTLVVKRHDHIQTNDNVAAVAIPAIVNIIIISMNRVNANRKRLWSAPGRFPQ